MSSGYIVYSVAGKPPSVVLFCHSRRHRSEYSIYSMCRCYIAKPTLISTVNNGDTCLYIDQVDDSFPPCDSVVWYYGTSLYITQYHVIVDTFHIIITVQCLCVCPSWLFAKYSHQKSTDCEHRRQQTGC